MTSSVCTAEKLCQALWVNLEGKSVEAKIHSSFQHAANLSTPVGMLTLLSPGRGLQPGSVVLRQTMDFSLLNSGTLTVRRSGIYRESEMLVDFRAAKSLNLTMQGAGALPAQNIGFIRSFLTQHQDVGLVSLVFDRAENPYAAFLSPRLYAFRKAVWEGSTGAALYAVRRIAGCGPGLTPSFDDWLCGYLAVLTARGGGQELIAALAETAAKCTNDISANLLRWAGKGCFSEDVLSLVACLTEERGTEERQLALERVADFGSSSGCDFLTGFYFGLLDIYANWRETT